MKHNWENYFDISSEYWKKVEKIYEENESFPKKVVKNRNLHHKFPRSFSKKDGAEIDNDDDNLVSLSLADHFRAHFYLWKCSKKGYRGMMAKAFVFMRKKMVKYATDETIEQLAKDYEEAMKDAYEATSEAMKGHPVSEETRKKLREAKKGKKMSEESKKKNAEAHKGKHTGAGNPFYGKHHSDEARRKIREAMKGENHPMYGKHHSEESKKKMREAKKGENHPMYGKHHTEETRKKIAEAQKGKPKSEETRNKLSAASKGNTNVKGKHWFNNGKINIMSKECPPGFVPGMLK